MQEGGFFIGLPHPLNQLTLCNPKPFCLSRYSLSDLRENLWMELPCTRAWFAAWFLAWRSVQEPPRLPDLVYAANLFNGYIFRTGLQPGKSI